MFGLGFSEIIVIGVLALILLGPEQLPDLARTLGRFINDLKRTSDNLKDEFEQANIHPARLLEEIQREAQPKSDTSVTPQGEGLNQGEARDSTKGDPVKLDKPISEGQDDSGKS
jgi:sec-independent protein translocase protein TatB